MNIDPTSKAEQTRQRMMRRRSVALREVVRRTTSCSNCKAIAGDYCTTKSGKLRAQLHTERWRQYVHPVKRARTIATDMELVADFVAAGRVMKYPAVKPDTTTSNPSVTGGGGKGEAARSVTKGHTKPR